MVAVAVGDINRCQVLAARRDPIYENVRLLDGDKGVDEDGDSLARDKCRRDRRPHQLFRAWSQVAAGRGYAGCHEHVPLQRKVWSSDFSLFLAMMNLPVRLFARAAC